MLSPHDKKFLTGLVAGLLFGVVLILALLLENLAL